MMAGRKFIGRAALAALLALLPTLANAAAPPGIPDGWSDGFVYANGIRIHYYHAVSAPGKPVLVMAHGASDNGLCWTTLAWKLQDAYDIYMVDARGHGLSDPNTPADDRDTAVKDLVGFLQVMKLEKPVLMGHSMGAGTVMRVGADYPDLAKAIVMLDPGLSRPGAAGGRGTPPTRPAQTPARGAAGSPQAGATPGRVTVAMAGSPETLVAQNNYDFDDLVALCRRQNPKWDLVDCQYWALSKKQYHGRYSTSATQPAPGGMSTGDILAKIQVPALILKADAPPDVRKTNEEAAKVMPRGTLVHIDGAAHNLHHDQLARTVEEFKKFMSSVH
jgi:pimeloyl-ACP methyl ester carboxylesterase